MFPFQVPTVFPQLPIEVTIIGPVGAEEDTLHVGLARRYTGHAKMLFIVSEKVPDGADMANEFASIIERCQTRHTDNILSFVEDPDHIHTAHADLLDKATDNVKHGWTKHDLAIVLEHKYWSSHKEDNNENEIAGVARAEQTTTDTFRQLEGLLCQGCQGSHGGAGRTIALRQHVPLRHGFCFRKRSPSPMRSFSTPP